MTCEVSLKTYQFCDSMNLSEEKKKEKSVVLVW